MKRHLSHLLAVALLVTSGTALALDAKQIQKEVAGGIKELRQVNGRLLLQDGLGNWHTMDRAGPELKLTAVTPPKTIAVNDPNKLPDTELALGTKNIKRAWFSRPTNRYGHGVLGDAIEAEAIKVELADGRMVEVVLDGSSVFEDRTPRLVDVNDDGLDEIIAVKSYLKYGAAVTLVGQSGDQLQILAEAPAIGLSHRWQNPVGAADFDGDGKTEIAVVITPHIGGTLQLYEWQGDQLVADHDAYGFSNHAMGSRELGLSAIIDVDQDGVMDIVVPDAGRNSLIATSFQNGDVRSLDRVDVAGQFTSGLFTADIDGDGRTEIIYATENKTLTVLQWQP